MSAAPPRILVADDSATIVALVTDVLCAEGYQVDVASTGSAAWSKLTNERYDLMLCDIVLPELDGPSLYRRLQASSLAHRPRVVFVSGYGAQHVQRILETTGAQLLNKPFQVTELMAVVRCNTSSVPPPRSAPVTP
jgi:DNA-binding response OmpR family regulator